MVLVEVDFGSGDELRELRGFADAITRSGAAQVAVRQAGDADDFKGAGSETFLEILAIASLPSLVSVLTAYVARDKRKTIKLSAKDKSVEITGDVDDAEIQRISDLLSEMGE